ncbi:MAG: HEAT repeat domain-containing protein [Planctomycetota bacterium]|jgi:hypothetical protein
MKVAATVASALLVLGARVRGEAPENRYETRNLIYRLNKDESEEATAALKGLLKADDFHVALLAALALAARGDAAGLEVLEEAPGKQPEELAGFHGLAFVDDPRVESIMAVEKLAPAKAFPLYVAHLDALREIHWSLWCRRWSGDPPSFSPDIAIPGAYRSAKEERKQVLLMERFAKRFEAAPGDFDAAYIYSGLLNADGRAREAREVRLAQIAEAARTPEEALLRGLDFEESARFDLRNSIERSAVRARLVQGYRDLLKLDAAEVEALGRLPGIGPFTDFRVPEEARPFMGSWGLDSLVHFKEIVKFRLANHLTPEETLEVLKEIFEANPKAQYGGCLVSALNGIFRELDRPETPVERRACYGKTVKMYAKAFRKSPADRKLKALYLRAVLAAEMADEGKRVMAEMLASADWAERADAIWPLARRYYRLEEGKRARDAVAMLAQALTDVVPYVRKRAAFELGQLHKPPESAARALRKATEDPDSEVRKEARQSLKNIRAHSPLPLPSTTGL